MQKQDTSLPPAKAAPRTDTALTQWAARLILPVCFLVLAAYPLAWIWGNHLHPIQDLPLHLANSFIVFKYLGTPFFQQNFTLLILPYPYLLQDAVLVPSMLFGYEAASKIFLTLTMGLLVWGVVFLVRTVERERIYLSLFVFPLLWNKVFFKGNFNCLLSICLALFAFGYLYSFAVKKPGRRDIWILAGLLVLLYFGHLAIYLVVTAIALLFVAVYLAGSERRRAARIALAIVPSAVMVLVFVIIQSVFPVEDEREVHFLASLPQLFTLRHIAGKFSEVKVLVSCFSPKEWSVVVPALALGALLMVGGCIEYRRKWPVLFIAAILGLAYFILPRDLYPMVRPHERVLFLLLFVAPACMGFPHALRGHRLIAKSEERVIAIALCMFTAFRLNAHVDSMTRQTAPVMRTAVDMLTELPSEKRLLPIFTARPVYGQIAYGRHIAFYYILERRGAVPALHHFAYALVREREKLPWEIDFAHIDLNVFLPYDLIFLWGDSPAMAANLRQLGFSPVRASGLVATYQRFGPGPSKPTE